MKRGCAELRAFREAGGSTEPFDAANARLVARSSSRAWGVLHGLWQDLETATERWRARWPRRVGVLVTFHVVVLPWVPFCAPSLAAAGTMLARLVSSSWDIATPTLAVVLTVAFLALQGLGFRLVATRPERPLRPGLELALAALMTWFLLAYGSARQDFIYFVF